MSAVASPPRRRSKIVPFTYLVGVRNTFGWLIWPDGTRRLVEPRLYVEHKPALAISLHDGQTLSVPADGTLQFERVAVQDACELAGIPEPTIDDGRRTDPYHVERHLSATFCALSELIRERRLPTEVALRHGRFDGNDGCHQEAPERFTTQVLERTGRGETLTDAIIAELAADSISSDGADLLAALHRSGWPAALAALAGRIAAHRDRLDDVGAPPPEADPAAAALF